MNFGIDNISEENTKGLEIAKKLKAFLIKEMDEDSYISYERDGIFRDGNALGYGDDSAVLTILHEEGDHKEFFDMDHCYAHRRENCYDPFEKLLKFANENGFMIEAYSTYVSTVYVNE